MITFFKPSRSLTIAVLTILSLGLTQLNAMTINECSTFLSANKENPEAVVIKIEELCSINIPFLMVAHILSKALTQAEMTIEAIKSAADMTVLHYACCKGYVRCLPVIFFLAKKPSDFVVLHDKSGWTPLHYAVVHRHTEGVKKLFKIGNPDLLLQAKNLQGHTPLDMAYMYNDHKMVVMLNHYSHPAKL